MNNVSRITGLIAALLVSRNSSQAQSPRASTPAGTQRVVFVCEHGTVKSLVALEVFNRLARRQNVRAQGISRGTHPDSAVPPSVSAGLLSDGFDVSAFRARLFTRQDLESSILVVALDASVDSVVDRAVPVVHWDGLPSVTADYRRARDAITLRVKHLVDSLATVRRKRQPTHRPEPNEVQGSRVQIPPSLCFYRNGAFPAKAQRVRTTNRRVSPAAALTAPPRSAPSSRSRDARECGNGTSTRLDDHLASTRSARGCAAEGSRCPPTRETPAPAH